MNTFTYTSSSFGQQGHSLAEYNYMDGKVVGVIWTGSNFYSVKQILGNGDEEDFPLGIYDGKLTFRYKGETDFIEIGDFIYTYARIEDFAYNPQEGGLFREHGFGLAIAAKNQYELKKV